jgi:ABC-type nitrate/sulfonate/bicarbonate transport system substrate-binding protein
MQLPLKPWSRLPGAVVLLALLVSACAPASTPAPTAAPTTAPKPAATSAPAATSGAAAVATSGTAAAVSGGTTGQPTQVPGGTAVQGAPTSAGGAATAAAKPATGGTPAAAAGPVTPGPVATKPATNPTDKMKLIFGGAVTPPNMVHLAPYIAKDQGFFDEVGLDVEIKSFEGGVGALRGGISGGLDVVATSSDPMFAAIQQGAPIKAIGTYAPKLSTMIMARPDVKTIQDLKGRKLGIQEVGGFSDVMFKLALQKENISVNDVQFVTITTANRVPAMVSGQVDAVVLHIDQYYTALSADPNFNVVAKMWEVAPNWWYAAFVATEDVIAGKREALNRFMTAVIKAQRFMYTNAAETKRIAVDETKAKPDVVEKAYADLFAASVWSVNDGMPKDLIDNTIEREVAVGTIKVEPKLTSDQIVEKSIVEEAIKRNGGPWTGDPRWY